MRLPRYEEYRDSGLGWLGTVPEHWPCVRLKFLADVQTGIAKGKSLDGKPVIEVPYLRVANVQDGYLDLGDVARIEIEPDQLDRYRLRVGDVLMNEGGDFDKLGRGCIWRGEVDDCIHQNHVFAVRPRDGQSAWINQYTSSPPAQFYFASVAKQSTNLASISSSNLMELPLPMPPASERRAIVDFLDHETAKIDGLIAEQEKLIALLAEKRQATISHAVTRGLNPQTPMKDSGVPWLGEVPVHWEVARVKALSQFTTSGSRGWSERITEDGSLFIQSGDLNDSLGLDYETAKRVNVGGDAEAARTRLAEGDVVVCITGAKTGNVAVCSALTEPAYVNQHLCLIRPTDSIQGHFLGYALKSTVGQLQLELSQYGLKQGLSLENVREVWVTHPSLDEQQVIIEWLDAEMDRFASLVAAAEAGVNLLRERRSALIAAAVTGQIDVRGFAAA